MRGAGVGGFVRACGWVCAAWACAGSALAGTPLTVVSVSPGQHAGGVSPTAPIVIQFSEPVNPTTVTYANVRVFGRWTGAAAGALALSNGDQTLTITPSKTFLSGDVVQVNLSMGIESAGGEPLRQGGWSHRYFVRVLPAMAEFTLLDTLTTVDPGDNVSPRPYGGQGSDLNADGSPDLTIVCEDTDDLRVFMSMADGSGLYHDFTDLPTAPVDQDGFAGSSTPSPNEPQDFNNDGHVDIATCNTSGDSVSILLGNGDGTFGAAQVVTLPGTIVGPHGLAALDVDGDGDMDLATSNVSPMVGEFTFGSISIIRNNGAGVFGSVTEFDSGIEREYCLSAADMNNDGIDDLIVGSRQAQQVRALLGDGAGNFAPQPIATAGGQCWMLVPGEVNGDGFMDITTGNSFSNSGTVFYGDGAGFFTGSQVVAAAAHVVATDVADVDGDGDADWLLSSFTGGEYRLYENNGAGVFTLAQVFPAVSNAACAVMLDIDGDGDIDLAQIDEIADTVTLRRNRGPLPVADINGDCVVNTADLGLLIAAFGGGAGPEDVNGDGVVNTADLGLMLGGFGEACPN